MPNGSEPSQSSSTINFDSSPLEWLTRASSFTLVCVAFAYCIGFVVVNSHLFQYGMVPHDFLQPRFLSAGFLYLAATALTVTFFSYLDYAIRKIRDNTVAQHLGAPIIMLAFLLLPTFFPWLWPKPDTHSQPTIWSQVGLPTLVILFLADAWILDHFSSSPVAIWWKNYMIERGFLKYSVLFALMVERLFQVGRPFAFYALFILSIMCWMVWGNYQNPRRTGLAFQFIVVPLTGLALLGFSVYAYAIHAYPLVSPHIGGGFLGPKKENQNIIGRLMGREHPECILHNVLLIHEILNFFTFYLMATTLIFPLSPFPNPR